MSKLRSSVYNFITKEGQHARLDNLTMLEINSIRPLLPHALDQVLRIQQVYNFYNFHSKLELHFSAWLYWLSLCHFRE